MTTFNFRGLPDCFVRMIRFFVLWNRPGDTWQVCQIGVHALALNQSNPPDWRVVEGGESGLVWNSRNPNLGRNLELSKRSLGENWPWSFLKQFLKTSIRVYLYLPNGWIFLKRVIRGGNLGFLPSFHHFFLLLQYLELRQNVNFNFTL